MQSIHRHRSLIVAICLFLGALVAPAGAAPALSFQSLSGLSTGVLVQGTGTYQLNLFLDSDGLPVSGLQYHFEVSPVVAVSYKAPVATDPGFAYDASVDLVKSPANGTAITGARTIPGVTVWLKSSDGDFATFDGIVGRYTFDTSALPSSPTPYVVQFIPVLEEISNADNVINTFDPPGTFSLTVVTAVPEPASMLGLTTLGVLALRRRRTPVN